MIALLVGLLVSSPVIAAVTAARSFWLPDPRSTLAGDVDSLFYFILWMSVFFFVGILGAIIFFLIRYRFREGGYPRKGPNHSTALELLWSGIPLLLVLVVFVMGFRGYLNMATPPENSYEIQVTAQKWSWSFTYPSGYVDSELHVPVDRPVKLTMSSQDVIHSFYVPDFRVKRDVVPGRYSTTWFQATEPGESIVFCAEYCGTQHSDMMTKVVVHEEGGFEDWLYKASQYIFELPPAEAGELLYRKRGCAQCHSLDGSKVIGPSFLGLWNANRPMQDGSNVVADENYIRESILNPRAKIVAGYDPVMPTFQGRIKDKEIDRIIAYIKSL